MRYQRTLHARRLHIGEPQPRNNRCETWVSHQLAIATWRLMLRLGKRQKPRWNALCCGVAGANPWARERIDLSVQYDTSMPSTKTSKERGIAENRAIQSFVDPTRRARVITLPAKHHIRVPDVGGLKSTRLGSPPKSRIRTGLPRLQICGARRMAHG
jgi:hypothetical protein